MAKGKVIVSTHWLYEHLTRDDIVIADCRFDLSDPIAGRAAYARDHIPGAVYFDLEEDLSGPVSGRGGRHPLPAIDEFSSKLGERGIGPGTTVVCYDDQRGQMAARFWWLLRYVGHDDVVVLDGGYTAWKEAGLPTTADVPSPRPRSFVPRVRPEMVASMDDVRGIVDGAPGIVVDARAPERYWGEVEPLDPVAGHIPGAYNLPWMDNVDENGYFKPAAELEQRFAQLKTDTEPVVLHCGSGVSACVNLLAMEHVGLRGAKLYVGSWSEWCSVPGNPIAVGDEKTERPGGPRDGRGR